MTSGYLAQDGQSQRIAWLGGSTHEVLLDGATTEGRLALFRSSMRGGTASPVHVHDHEDETIVVLAGDITFWAGGERWEATAGDTMFLPRDVPHAYTVTSDSADILSICNPAGMEAFFRTVGWDLAEPPPHGWQVDPQVLAAAGEAGGQHVLGPPLPAAEAAIPAALLNPR